MQENKKNELKNYVTTDKLALVEKDIAVIKQDISWIKDQMATKADLEKVSKEILNWMFGMFATIMIKPVFFN